MEGSDFDKKNGLNTTFSKRIDQLEVRDNVNEARIKSLENQNAILKDHNLGNILHGKDIF